MSVRPLLARRVADLERFQDGPDLFASGAVQEDDRDEVLERVPLVLLEETRGGRSRLLDRSGHETLRNVRVFLS